MLLCKNYFFCNVKKILLKIFNLRWTKNLFSIGQRGITSKIKIKVFWYFSHLNFLNMSFLSYQSIHSAKQRWIFSNCYCVLTALFNLDLQNMLFCHKLPWFYNSLLISSHLWLSMLTKCSPRAYKIYVSLIIFVTTNFNWRHLWFPQGNKSTIFI